MLKYGVVCIVALLVIAGLLLFSYRKKMVSPVTEEQRKEIAGRMTAHTFESSNLDSSIPYRLYAPEVVKRDSKVPLVLYLHGSDGRGDDNYRQLNEIVDVLTSLSFQKQFPSYVLVPQCPRGHQWVDLKMSSFLCIIIIRMQ